MLCRTVHINSVHVVWEKALGCFSVRFQATTPEGSYYSHTYMLILCAVRTLGGCVIPLASFSQLSWFRHTMPRLTRDNRVSDNLCTKKTQETHNFDCQLSPRQRDTCYDQCVTLFVCRKFCLAHHIIFEAPNKYMLKRPQNVFPRGNIRQWIFDSSASPGHSSEITHIV